MIGWKRSREIERGGSAKGEDVYMVVGRRWGEGFVGYRLAVWGRYRMCICEDNLTRCSSRCINYFFPVNEHKSSARLLYPLLVFHLRSRSRCPICLGTFSISQVLLPLVIAAPSIPHPQACISSNTRIRMFSPRLSSRVPFLPLSYEATDMAARRCCP